MSELLGSLGFQPLVVLSQVLAFLVLFFVLWKFLFKRIGAAMDARTQEIQSTFDKIEHDKTEIERLTQEYQGKLANIEKEAYERIQKAVQEGIQAKNEITTQAQALAQKTMEKARAEIEREKDKALLELRQQVVTLSLQVAEKLINATMNAQTHGKLVDQFLTEVEKTKR